MRTTSQRRDHVATCLVCRWSIGHDDRHPVEVAAVAHRDRLAHPVIVRSVTTTVSMIAARQPTTQPA